MLLAVSRRAGKAIGDFEFQAVPIDFEFTDFNPEKLIEYLKREGFLYIVKKVDFLKGEKWEEVDCFENLVKESKIKSPYNTQYFEYNLKFARQHRDTIERFGRFPLRNAILGR